MADGRTRRHAGFEALEPEGEWTEYAPGTVFSCQVYLVPDVEGGFSASVADLPGVASEGDTEEETLANITEALAAAIEAYKQEGRKAPWLKAPRSPHPEALTRWVTVHV